MLYSPYQLTRELRQILTISLFLLVRSVIDILCGCIHITRPTAHILLCRIQKDEASIVRKSVPHHHTEAALFCSVLSVTAACSILHSTRICSTLLVLLLNVSFLSTGDDMCVINCVLLGRGEFPIA